MIKGVGCDIIGIERIKSAMQREGFPERIFTDSEREYLTLHNMKAESAAGMFAAKEAVSKALGTGISGFSMRDIEILHEANGKPYAVLHGGAEAALSGNINISISHSEEYAVAYAVIDSE